MPKAYLVEDLDTLGYKSVQTELKSTSDKKGLLSQMAAIYGDRRYQLALAVSAGMLIGALVQRFFGA